MGKRSSTKGTSEAEPPTEPRAPIGLLAASWFVPGLGHWLLRRRARALVFAGVVLAAFVTGVLLEGELGVPREQSPFSWLATIACLGNGMLYGARLLWVNGFNGLVNASFPYGMGGGGNPIAVGFSYGNTFLYTAGLMNLLAVLDVSDIARGVKS